ncbi:MAG: DUF1761 domain-containing protein [Spirochaetia bacterium]|jgi:hypothetical protein
MANVNFLAVLVAAVAAFIVSIVWYIVFNKARMRLLGMDTGASSMRGTPPWKMLIEIARSFIVAYVLARIMAISGMTGLGEALKLGSLAWIGFPVMILAGSVQWEKVPWKLAAIHAGDWFLKLLVLTIILGVWR